MKEAYDYVSRIDSKIILIDGEQLTQFVIDNNVGVSTISMYAVKRNIHFQQMITGYKKGGMS